MNTPRKPSDAAFALWELGRLRDLHVEQRQTGTDTADTWVRFTNGIGAGKVEGWWSTYAGLVDVRVGYDYVAELKREVIAQIEAWLAFEKKERRDMSEYRRLHKKFGGVTPRKGDSE